MRWTDKKNEKTTVGLGATGATSKIVQVVWPEKAGVNSKREFAVMCEMENASDVGYIAIVNEKGNPGNLVFDVGGRQLKVSPGYALSARTDSPVCAGCKYMIQGYVSFDNKGTYTITILAGVQ